MAENALYQTIWACLMIQVFMVCTLIAESSNYQTAICFICKNGY